MHLVVLFDSLCCWHLPILLIFCVYLSFLLHFRSIERDRKRKKPNTMASSIAAGAGSTDPTAARRNTKRPKCNNALSISLISCFFDFLAPFSVTHFLFFVDFFGLWWKFRIFFYLGMLGRKGVLGLLRFFCVRIKAL